MVSLRPAVYALTLGIGASAALVANSTPSPSTSAAASTTARPNFVMITADDAAVSDLRYMPHTRALIQQRGVTLTNAIAPTPICVPARASLLTGQYADNHGAVTISGPRGGFGAFRDASTLPVWLRSAGYSTMFTGKYLNGYGARDNRNYIPPGWDNWRATTSGTYGFFNTTFNVNGRQQRSRGYSTDAITEHAVGMLDWQHRAPGKPFLMWVNYVGPHHGGPRAKDDPPRRWPRDRSVWLQTTSPAPADNNRFARTPIPAAPDLWERDIRGNRFAGPVRSPRYRAAMLEVFQQRIEALQSVDRGVARIINRLYRNGDLGHTFVVFASDNGYLTGHHNRDGKLVPYDRSVRIPMVMRGPGMPQNALARTTVSNADLPVSFAAAAGVRPGHAVDGVPVFDQIRRLRGTRPVPISGWPVEDGRTNLYRGIRYGGYTYVRYGHRVELYDRGRDPGELTNYAGYRAYATQLAMMSRLYTKYAICRANSCPRTWE